MRPKSERVKDRTRLKTIRAEVLEKVPGAAIASDQFCRLFDLAIDFSEDVKPLPKASVQTIVEIFKRHGAIAKVSNIHVNGWFGKHDKLSTCLTYLKKELELEGSDVQKRCAFVGDSPNDEPMFKHFQNSFAVANIQPFLNDLNHKPKFVTSKDESEGFCQLGQRLLELAKP